MCGLEVVSEGKNIISVKGDKKDPLSKGHMCPKGSAIKDLYEDPDRLKQPVRQTKSGWEKMEWDDAFNEVEQNLKKIRSQFGNDAIGIYFGNPNAHYHGNILFLSFLLKALNTKNRFSASSADQLPLMMACREMFGHQFLFPIPDVDRTDYFMIIGGNPAISGGSIMSAPGIKRRIKSIQKRGGKVIVIDPVFTKTAELANQHLFIKPGTDTYLLGCMLNTIFNENLEHPGWVHRFSNGFDTIKEAVKEFKTDWVETVTGIKAEDVKTLAREFSHAKSAVCYGRMGSCVQEFGTVTSWLILVLNIVTGKIDRPGGIMFPTPALDLATMTAIMKEKGGIGKNKTKVRGLSDFGGEFPLATLAEEMLTDDNSRIRGFICINGNPALSAPNGKLFNEALPRLDYMVSMDWYVTETSRHSNIILPPTHMFEHDHFPVIASFGNVRNIAKYSGPVIEPDQNTKHGWEIIKELSCRMEKNPIKRLAVNMLSPEKLLEIGIRFGPYGAGLKGKNSGLTLENVKKHVHGIDLGPLRTSLPKRLFTKNNQINLAPELFVNELNTVKNKLHSDNKSNNFDMVLITRRNLMSNNSWLHNIERLHNKQNRCSAWLNPKDAGIKGIKDGDEISVFSSTGTIILECEITDKVMRGVISIPHDWGHGLEGVRLSVASKHAGVSLNDITDHNCIDTLSGNAVFSGVPVKIKKN